MKSEGGSGQITESGRDTERRLLGEVELRNPHRVYAEGAGYAVVSESPNGQRYERWVSRQAVEHVRSKLGGQQVTSSQAARSLQPVARRMGLIYTYGRKLQYSAQDVLLVLAALGYAGVEKEGRSYVYTLR